MSNDSPVKGFRKLGGAQQPPDQPTTSPDPWQNTSQSPEPQPDPFAPPPSSAAPSPWPAPGQAAIPDPWQAAAPPPPPGVSNVPNPPPPAPWQASVPNQPQSNPNPYPPGAYYAPPRPGPSPDTAYILNLIFGLFGLFGIGSMYAGKTGEGLIMLFGGIMMNLTVAVLGAITAGILACLALPFYVLFAVLSANSVKKYLLDKYQQQP